MMFKNVSKKKALISDSEDTEREGIRKIKNNNLVGMVEEFK